MVLTTVKSLAVTRSQALPGNEFWEALPPEIKIGASRIAFPLLAWERGRVGLLRKVDTNEGKSAPNLM